MKDIRFNNHDNTVNVVFRTDLINSDAQNFTVMSISGLDTSIRPNHDNKALLVAFKQLAYNLPTFIQFALDNGLALSVANADGTGLVYLVDVQDSSASF